MNKKAFLNQLQQGMNGLTKNEIDERLTFYREMIDDRIEEGLSENDAVASVGSIDDILSEINAGITTAESENQGEMHRKKWKAWEITLLAVGSPIWLSLLIAVFVVFVALYISVWSIVISIWAVFVSILACSLGSLAGSIALFCTGHHLSGFALLGICILSAGLSIFLFIGCREATKGVLLLTGKGLRSIKKIFVKEEGA